MDLNHIHPVADLFPMMSDEELDDLAADIKANGLINPVVIDLDGTLIDGRNRLEACRRAGVLPSYTTLDEGRDPVAYILGANIARRHLNKGQAAMAMAMVSNFLETKKFGDGQITARVIGVSGARLSQAILVSTHASELGDQVLAGALSLDKAYDEAKARKKGADTAESEWATLQGNAPDLALQVTEETLTLAEAIGAYKARDRKAREHKEGVTKSLAQALMTLWAEFDGRERDFTEDWLPEANPFRNTPEVTPFFTAPGVRKLATHLKRLADDIDRRGGTL